MVMLRNDKAIEKLEQQISIVSDLRQKQRNSPDFEKWKRDTKVAIQNIFGQEAHQVTEFGGIRYSLGILTTTTPQYALERAYHSGLERAVAMLRSMIDEIREYREDAPQTTPREAIEILDRICAGFHRVVVQLRARHAGRTTIDVDDEYDVQDLIHALLMVDFQDIRREEWTPSYAGGSSRVDFLLKHEQVVIEIKKSRKGLGAREVGDQLLIDIGRYHVHPECKFLYCFVYDPDNRVTNPRGIERDLSKSHGNLPVKVVIAP